MSHLVQEILNLIATKEDNLTFEEMVYDLFSREFSIVMAKVLENLDKRLIPKMQAEGYLMKRKDQRNIEFLFGNVCFTRRLWKRGKEYIYPLDQLMGFLPRLRYSPLVQAKLSELSTIGEFRKIAKAVNSLTTLQVSASGVHGMVQRVSKKVERHEEIKNELVYEKKKEVPVLYLEGDTLSIKSQDKGIINISRFQVHEGVKKSGKRGYCINTYQFSGSSRIKVFKKMLDYLQKHYDLSNTIVLSNSDGGSGYEPEVFQELALGCKQHEHFLDRYHLNRKIRERMYFCPQELLDKMMVAVKQYSKKDVIRILDTIESIAEAEKDRKARKYTKLLREYLARNWPYMKPLRLRGFSVSISRGGLGVCESRHRPFSYRMKRQGRSWGRLGAENMVRLINTIQNKEFEEAIRSNWEKVMGEVENVKVDINKLLRPIHEPHVGVKQGGIRNNNGSRTALGGMKRIFEH